MDSSSCRALRLIVLIRRLCANPRGYRKQELAKMLRVSCRTIQRDLALIQEEPLRVPLWRDEDYRWRVLEGWHL